MLYILTKAYAYMLSSKYRAYASVKRATTEQIETGSLILAKVNLNLCDMEKMEILKPQQQPSKFTHMATLILRTKNKLEMQLDVIMT